jgi:Zinc finger, C3HC4 type (RING finger)
MNHDNNNSEAEVCGEVDPNDVDDEAYVNEQQQQQNPKKRSRRVYNGMIECNVEPIRTLLTCTLCEGLFREPYTTVKCFHTFCKSCLTTAIRSSYNTLQYNCCPICQTYFGRDDIVTNNALPDRVLETLIDKVLFPHLSHQDFQLECEFYTKRSIKRKENISLDTSTTTTTAILPANETPKKEAINAINPDSTTATAANAITASVPTVATKITTKRNHPITTLINNPTQRPTKPYPTPRRSIVLNDDNNQMITFQLVPYPCTAAVEQQRRKTPPLPNVVLPFFTTSAQIHITQIKKLLHMKLFPQQGHSSKKDTIVPQQPHEQQQQHIFELYCNVCLLEDELSLNFISHVLWDTNDNDPTDNNRAPLKLEYKYIYHQA